MLTLPEVPKQSHLSVARRSALRETPLGEELSARVSQEFEKSLPGQAIEDAGLDEAPRADDISTGPDPRRPLRRAKERLDRTFGPRVGTMPKEAYEASPHFREGVEWDERMTEDRAEALAEIVDKRNYRNSLFERSPGGIGRTVAGFGASLLGAAPDPINYIPIFGPAARAAAVSRLGVIGGRASLGAAEGAAASALVSPFIAQNINKKGGNITANDVAMDIVLSAVLGSAFGAGSGLIDKRRAARALRQDGAKRELAALEKAVEDLSDDVPVDVRDVSMMGRRERSLPDAIERPDVVLLPDAIQGSRLPDALPRTRLQTLEEAAPADSGVGIDQQVARQFSAVSTPRRSFLPDTADNPAAVSRAGPLQGQRVRERGVLPPARPRQVADFEDGTDAFLRRIQDQRAREALAVRQRAKPRDGATDVSPKIAESLSKNDAALAKHVLKEHGKSSAQVKAIEKESGPAGLVNAAIDTIKNDPVRRVRGASSGEQELDLGDIPFFDEAQSEMQARSKDRSDFDDAALDPANDPLAFEVEAMRDAGELNAEDLAELDELAKLTEQTEKYAISYETLAGCVIRHG